MASKTEIDEELLSTIPKDRAKATTVEDFNYYYDKNDCLRHRDSQKPFRFVSQRHYDALGDAITLYLATEMKKRYEMVEYWLPLTGPASSPASGSRDVSKAQCNIFVSKDFFTNKDKCMVLLQGSGDVRPGMWARSLCTNEPGLSMGSVFPYIERAHKQGYSTIVLNPNMNKAFVPDDDQKTSSEAAETKETESALDYFLSKEKKGYPIAAGSMLPVKHNEDPVKHVLYVWDNFLKESPAKDIVVVAHSAGGAGTMALLNSRTAEALARVRAVAFTDSVHSVSPRDAPAVRDFIRNHAVNWAASEKPLDTPLPVDPFLKQLGQDGCPCVSAGHEKHVWTSGTAFEAVFKFFTKKLGR